MVDGAIRWHEFDVGTFDVGREEMTIAGLDQTIGIYSAERTLADCFRTRHVVGYETARHATREWLCRGGKLTALLAVASTLPRTQAPVLHALEMLA